jgi:hypothetical protein
MIIAVRTDALVLGELDFVNDFAASCALLKEPMRNIALLGLSAFIAGFLKMAMEIRLARRWPREQR